MIQEILTTSIYLWLLYEVILICIEEVTGKQRITRKYSLMNRILELLGRMEV